MFRLSTALCPFCEARAFARTSTSPSWQPIRNAATLQKRRPSRMTLSPHVRRGPPAPVVGKERPPAKRERPGPFGAMNSRAAPREVQFAKARESATEQRRGNRRAEARGKSGGPSRDPMKALKMQRSLSNVSYEKRSQVKQDLAVYERFQNFDLMPVIQESVASQALGGMVGVSPTPIQRLAIPALLGSEGGKRRKKDTPKMQQFLLAAETGSGKTLAYLLPTIDALKRAEVMDAAAEVREKEQQEAQRKRDRANSVFGLPSPEVDEPDPNTARPRAIILLPTAELVDQVGQLVKSLGHTVKYRAAVISASYTGQVIRSRLFSTGGVDIVISTPHLLGSISEADPNILSRVTHLVIDEADSLFDRSFAPITSTIIDRATPSLKQLVLCSATIPRKLDTYLQKRYPEIRRLATPHLHSIPRRVQLSVVDIEKVPFQGNRDLACAQTIWDIGREGGGEEGAGGGEGAKDDKKIVVFVNEREKADELGRYLQAKGIEAFSLMRDSDERKRSEVLRAFTGLGSGKGSPLIKSRTKGTQSNDRSTSSDRLFDSPPPPPSTPSSSRRQLANTKVLVMTDLGSRGIDTLPVRNVVLYDVPHTSIDFIHRLGRVGRMGRRGRGVVLVGKNDRKDIVKEVREGMFRGQALI